MSWTKIDAKSGISVELDNPGIAGSKEGKAGWTKLQQKYPSMERMESSPRYFRYTQQGSGVVTPLLEKQIVPLGRICDKLPTVSLPFVETEKPAANFAFQVVARYRRHQDINQFEQWIRIAIDLDEMVLTLDLRASEYKDLAVKIRTRYPQCYITNPEVFARMGAHEYGEACKTVKEVDLFDFGGWYKRRSGQLVFLHDRMPNVHADVTLSADWQQASLFLPQYWQVSSEHSKLAILLLYAAWANLSAFYDEASYQDKGLRCALYLAAPTGTGKTTLANLFVRALATEGKNFGMRFEDTIASLQENLVQHRDVLSIVDDFFCQGSVSEDTAYRKKASEITRIAGDGRIKGKMGPDRKPLPDRKYRGGIVVTGEYIDLNTYSSYLRCWQVEFPEGTIKFNNAMASLTETKEITQSFLSLWIEFLTRHQTEIIGQVPTRYNRQLELVRSEFSTCKHARFITNVTTFLVTAELLSEFCQESHLPLTEDLQTAVWFEAREQLRSLVALSPEEIFVRAFWDACDSGELEITATEGEFCREECQGYIAGEYVHVTSKAIDTAVTKFAQKHNYGLRFNNTLKESLVSQGILRKAGQAFSWKYTKDRLVSKPRRPRLYTLRINTERKEIK